MVFSEAGWKKYLKYTYQVGSLLIPFRIYLSYLGIQAIIKTKTGYKLPDI